MKLNKKYAGLIIGSIFTAGSLLSTLTILVPILSMLPGAKLESIIKSFIPDSSNSTFGILTILIESFILLLTIFLFSLSFRKRARQHKPVENGMVILLMSVCYFIVHPLGFEIYWGLVLDFRSDGQLALSIFFTYPVTSFAFVFIGGIIDLTKNIAARKVWVQ